MPETEINPDLAALAAEAAMAQPAADPLAQPAPTYVEPQPLPPQVQALVGHAVRMGGAIACRKANVTTLEEHEVGALAQAACDVARYYITNTMDPKVAAWLGLGLTAMAVVANRRPLASQSDAPTVTPPMGEAPPVDPSAIVAAQAGAIDAMMGHAGTA